MGGIGKKVTVGYKYYLGMHMILCHGPVDKVTRIEVDGKTAWSGNATGGPISINAPDLFGGESREGGVSGTVDIEMGGPLQGRNAYLQSRLGTDIPAYRGVLGAVLKQVYVGMNPYLKRWAFWASRIHVRQDGIPQWYDEKAEINGDMNPAHIIRECLTDPDWGMGYPEADIDDASFKAAADQMYNEGMGMSLLWDRSATLEEFIQVVLKHIDGSIYVDRSTGKFVLKLARGGYDINSLLVLDESSVDHITDFKRSTIGELVNSVTVVYWDASTGKNNSVTVQDIALAAQQQATIGTTVQFPGFTNGTIATKAATRTLKALSTPLASATIYANRKAASLNVGDVFVLTWPRYGISQLVMRVTNVEMGALGSNVVKIQAVEDVFALPNAIYAPPPPSGWSDPNTQPAPCPYHCVIEAPFWELVQRMGETDARALPATAGFVVATGVRPSSDASNAKLYTDVTGVWEEAGTVDFCPTAVLTAAVSPNTTTFPIGAGVDLDVVQVGTYALIDSELVRIDAVSDTSLTVGRGVLDTVPKPHAVGARLFFADAFFESDGIEYATGEQADIRLLPSTGLGTLDLASAPTQSVAIVARQYRPYPPGRFRIDGLDYPDEVFSSTVLVTWAHRDRLQQTAGTLIDHTAGDIGPEDGTTYRLRVYDESMTQVQEFSALTGTSQLVDLSALPTEVATIMLWSERDGLLSWQAAAHTFTFTLATLFVVLPLTYDEEDADAEMTWTRLGSSPHVTPEGFEGNGWNSRLKSTTIPTWMANANGRVTLHASVTISPDSVMNASGDTVVYMGPDSSGTLPNPKLALRVLRDPVISRRNYLALQSFTSSLQTIPLFRPEWKFQGQFPVLTSGGFQVRPQGLLFLDANTLLVSGHYQDNESRVYKIDLTDGSVVGEFTFGTSTFRHIASFAKNAAGDVWCVDYETGRTLKIDLDASFTSGSAVVLANWNTSILNKVSGIEFITISGTEYVLIGEYATSGTPYLYVIPASQMVDGATFAVASRYKRFPIGIHLQGIAIKDGHLWATKNRGLVATTLYGWLERFDNIEAFISGQPDGTALSTILSYTHSGPSGHVEDIKFHPTTGEAWTMTEGWQAVGDLEGFLSIWSSPADGSSVENHVTVHYTGMGEVKTKLNNKLFHTASWTPSLGVETVSVGGPPQATAGLRNGFFKGYVRNVRFQNKEMTDTEYNDTVTGTFEPNSLTAYVIPLTNPGAESGTTGWTNEVGSLGTRNTLPTPYEGSAYFFGGANAQTIARQRVDLLAATGLTGTQVDAGDIWAKLRWHQASFSDQDPATMGLRMLDSTPTQISLTYGDLDFVPYGDDGATPNWQRLALGVDIPPGCRFVDAVYRSDRTSGTNNDGYIDAISMIVYRR